MALTDNQIKALRISNMILEKYGDEAEPLALSAWEAYFMVHDLDAPAFHKNRPPVSDVDK